MYKSSTLTSSCQLESSDAGLAVRTRAACESAAKDLTSNIDVNEIELLIAHFSVEFDLPVVTESLSNTFKNTQIIGCTSAGEFNKNGYNTHSIVLIALLKSDFACAVEVVSDFDQLEFNSAHKIAADLRQKLREKTSFRPDQMMVLSYLDGLGMNEERFLNTFSSAFGNIPHFGGSAGDDLKLQATYVLHNQHLLQDAAVIALVGSKRPFSVFYNDHIEAPVSRLVVTEANPATRTVYELNGEPAADYYARLLGKKTAELTPEIFSTFPLAVFMGNKYYIRSIQKVDASTNSLMFYCAVDLGMILTVVQLGDVAGSLEKKLESLSAELGEADLVYGCDCFLRRLDVTQNKQQDNIKALQQQYKIAGFNAYGEHMNAIHMNQTFTGVYFANHKDQ